MKSTKKLFIFPILALLACTACSTINSGSNSNSANSAPLSENTSSTNQESASPSHSNSSVLPDSSSIPSSSIVYVNSLELNAENRIMKIGEQFSLKCIVLPEDATDKSVTWTSSSSSIASVDENGVVLAKSVGTAIIKVTANDGSKVSTQCTISVESNESSTLDLITSESDLHVGDIIVIANSDGGNTAGQIKTGSNTHYLEAVSSTFSNDKKSISSLNENATLLTIGKNNNYWTLSNENGELLGATSAKNLAWDSGSTTWNISIASNGNATISNTQSNYGTLYYNKQSPRFTTYTSVQTYPQIYRGKIANPVYAESIEIVGKSDLAIGEETQLYVNYTPSNTNMKDVTWQSSNTSIASISNKGLVTALKEGTATISAIVKGDNNNLIQDNITITIKAVPVTGINLNNTSIELAINKTSKLTANILPNNATNKNVTWTSSNNSIATVKDGTVTGISAGSAIITATTEDGNFKATCNVEVKDIVLDDYTIMIYMCGSDLESASDGGLATDNITEILSVKNKPDNVNIIIETGGAKKWKTKYGISANYLQRWHVENNQLVKDDQLTKASMGLSSTFQSFMEWGLTEYPASQTGVVLWNHGGAMDGCCYDENFNDDPLTNSEVHTALKNAFKNVGRTEKLSWIGYDACLMAVADVADLNSDYFEYMVASQESEPGEGWDYDNWIDNIYSNTKIEAPELLIEISDTFVTKCAASYNSYGGQYRGFNDATMSVLDLSKMPSFREAWENMALKLSSIITSSSSWSTFKTLVKKCQQFGYDDEYGYSFDVFDMKDFIDLIKANSTYSQIGINDVENAFNALVIYNTYGKDSADASGLCFFCAVYGYSQKSTYTTSDTYFTNWRNLNIKYGTWY
ncbi:MAG: Ig-like domain-containing protein [Erysipelotrichales bacterium]|nr:Ig-like domain-containing protein [Erysipelotrichales bacterium]